MTQLPYIMDLESVPLTAMQQGRLKYNNVLSSLNDWGGVLVI